jgi:response regulator NasT
VPIILLVGHDAAEFVRRAREVGIMASLVTPTEQVRLAKAVTAALARFKEFQAIQLETEEPEDALVIWNETERAKHVLMRSLKISEPEAFRRLWRSRTAASSLRELTAGIVGAERLIKDASLIRNLQAVLAAIRRGLGRTPQGSIALAPAPDVNPISKVRG